MSLRLVLVDYRFGVPILHRQAGLGAVASSNPALMIDAENQCLVRRIEIEPDHILGIGGEVFIMRDLECPDEMGWSPCVRQIRWTLVKEMPAATPCCARCTAPRSAVSRATHVEHLNELLRRQQPNARGPGSCPSKSPSAAA